MIDSSPPLKQPALDGRIPAFAWVLVSVVAMLYLLPLFLLRMPSFQSWNTSPLAVAQDYVFTTPHIDADIILMGDSSTEFGVDPRQISAAFGLKTVNLANNLQTLPVISRLELDRYLSQNKRPRLLVFYLTAWDLDFFQIRFPHYEGEEMLLRYGSTSDILGYTWHHSADMLSFPLQFYAFNTPFDPERRHWPAATNKAIIQHLGHAALGPEKLPLTRNCAFSDRILGQSGGTASIDLLLQEYRGSADKVILYVAPIPLCRGYKALLNGPYTRLEAAPPKVLSANGFGDDTYFAHPIPSAVPTITQVFIDALREQGLPLSQ